MFEQSRRPGSREKWPSDSLSGAAAAFSDRSLADAISPIVIPQGNWFDARDDLPAPRGPATFLPGWNDR
jgi:hypothetical protein